jgi:TIR domain-containing protein
MRTVSPLVFWCEKRETAGQSLPVVRVASKQMNVFLAWSGPASHKVAEALRKWLPLVLQKVKPFLSSSDINKGERWRNELAAQVEKAAFAILCLTPDALTSTWIHFEAGAVSRQASEGRVTGLLVGVKPSEVVDPLAQFQNTPANEAEVKKLVQTLNKLLAEDRLEDSVLDDAFATYWPRLQAAIEDAQKVDNKNAPPRRTTEEMLAEILENTRTQGRNLSVSLEMQKQLLSAREPAPVVAGTGLLGNPMTFVSSGGLSQPSLGLASLTAPVFSSYFNQEHSKKSAFEEFVASQKAQNRKLTEILKELERKSGLVTTPKKKDDKE